MKLAELKTPWRNSINLLRKGQNNAIIKKVLPWNSRRRRRFLLWLKQGVARLLPGKKQIQHFVNVWIRLYFYTIEVLFDRNKYDANLLAGWASNYYKDVYRYLEENDLVNFDIFYECWQSMVSQSSSTFVDRIINISYPEFYDIISSNQRLID